MPSKNPYRIASDSKVKLRDIATKDDSLFKGDKQQGLKRLEELAGDIALLQDKLYANRKQRMLIVLQGMDGAGKSSTIRDIFCYSNPLGVHARSFGKPSEEELKRDYMWRIHAHIPRLGEITVFDRSHYEDVTTVKVLGLVDNKQIKKRLKHIQNFEQMLIDENTTVLKFFLHLSKQEQAKQLAQRLEDDSKSYKFNSADLATRSRWDDYEDAWSSAISQSSTSKAPWYVIPADRRWYRKLAIAHVVREALADMKLDWPKAKQSAEETRSWLEALK